MIKSYNILEYTEIINQLAELANSKQAKNNILSLEPILSETELMSALRDTSQARQMIDTLGNPPLPMMERIEEYVDKAMRSELLLAEEIEQVGYFLTSIRRLKDYLGRGQQYNIGISFYGDNLIEINELAENIERSVRGGRIDDYASNQLKDIRRELIINEEKIKNKAESALKANKNALAENFVVKRNGRTCLPIKKEYRSKIQGNVIDKSATGSTLFIEPTSIMTLREAYENLKIEEDMEERRILYTLMDMIAENELVLRENIRTIITLDFVFAKGKLSANMKAVEPSINVERDIRIINGRHPLLKASECVPLNFSIGNESKGMIITGPNTGGKTVAIKTVGLFCLMACSGLHIPCESADICMNNQVLCDIGDGQNISDNLSTFSSHIKNLIDILSRTTEESLVILDELGSGTDPAEGMGIAIAILEQLRRCGSLFLVTTHYPEVKRFADEYDDIINASMAFDRENLKPLYRLEMGKSGESCALYIAKRLGVPDFIVERAARHAYTNDSDEVIRELHLTPDKVTLKKKSAPKIVRHSKVRTKDDNPGGYSRGDSVVVYPEEQIGIVVNKADNNGDVLVQVKKEKILVNHKRLKLKVAASELYPEDYDFSIIFDTVENRKARHKMQKGYQKDLTITQE